MLSELARLFQTVSGRLTGKQKAVFVLKEMEDCDTKEIAAILRKEDPEFYRLLPEPMIKALEPMKIDHWRHWNRRTLATNAVVVNKESGGYIRFAVTSVDYDLMMLNAVIDAFLWRLFGH